MTWLEATFKTADNPSFGNSSGVLLSGGRRQGDLEGKAARSPL